MRGAANCQCSDNKIAYLNFYISGAQSKQSQPADDSLEPDRNKGSDSSKKKKEPPFRQKYIHNFFHRKRRSAINAPLIAKGAVCARLRKNMKNQPSSSISNMT